MLVVQSLGMNDQGQLVVTWQSVPGKTYTVVASVSPAGPYSTVLASRIATNTGAVDMGSNKFLQVIVEP